MWPFFWSVLKSRSEYRVPSRKEKITSTIKRDIGRLRKPIHKKSYQDHIRNRLATFEQQEVESSWTCITDAVKRAAKATLGKKPKVNRKEWFDEACR